MNPTGKKRPLMLRVPQAFVDRIDGEGHRRQLRSREETMRVLITEALDASRYRPTDLERGTTIARMNRPEPHTIGAGIERLTGKSVAEHLAADHEPGDIFTVCIKCANPAFCASIKDCGLPFIDRFGLQDDSEANMVEATHIATVLCSDCPPDGYPTDVTRCTACPRGRPTPPRPKGGILIDTSPRPPILPREHVTLSVRIRDMTEADLHAAVVTIVQANSGDVTQLRDLLLVRLLMDREDLLKRLAKVESTLRDL